MTKLLKKQKDYLREAIESEDFHYFFCGYNSDKFTGTELEKPVAQLRQATKQIQKILGLD